MSALLNRLRDCRALASILKRLRRFPNQSAIVDDFLSSTDFEPLRPHLFNSRSIFGEWLKDLRQLGVPNPEAYALSRVGFDFPCIGFNYLANVGATLASLRNANLAHFVTQWTECPPFSY